MKTKKILPILMIGLFMAILLMPSNTLTDKPNHALTNDDVQGWWQYDEGLTMSNMWYKFNLTMWWQIWINNQTIQVNASAAWANASKAICIMYITFPDDIESEWWLVLKVWFEIITYTDVDFDGFDHDLIWEDAGIQMGLATEDEYFILVMGYNETTGPTNPFDRWWTAKTPTDMSNATVADITYMLSIVAQKFDKVPGFEIATILIVLVVITGIIFQRRKWQSSNNFIEVN